MIVKMIMRMIVWMCNDCEKLVRMIVQMIVRMIVQMIVRMIVQWLCNDYVDDCARIVL